MIICKVRSIRADLYIICYEIHSSALCGCARLMNHGISLNCASRQALGCLNTALTLLWLSCLGALNPES